MCKSCFTKRSYLLPLNVTFIDELLKKFQYFSLERPEKRMNYWGGATGHVNKCACGVTNSCSSGYMCNCRGSFSGWREDGGLLTDKAVLPVTQVRLGDLDGSHEKGYYTLGKLKCYGVA